MIPHSRPALGPEEEAAACRVVRSGYLAQGSEVAALEAELGATLGVEHVVAVSSGSAALHLSLLALGIQPADRVAMPSYVCSALLHAVQHIKARPLLVDIDPDTLNIAPDDLARHRNLEIRAAFVPHMFGKAADLQSLLDLDIPIIEDCAMSLGAIYKGRKLGSLGRLSIFSFYATKVLCAGEGGAVATSSPEMAAQVRDLRDYDGRTDAQPRYNYKLTDLQAAIARVQLQKLHTLIARRRELGARYDRELSRTGAHLPGFEPGDYPFRYVVLHPDGAADLIPRFEAAGVAARRPVFCPIHRCLNLSDSDFPHTSDAYRRALSLPLYPDLSEPEVARVLQTAREVL